MKKPMHCCCTITQTGLRTITTMLFLGSMQVISQIISIVILDSSVCPGRICTLIENDSVEGSIVFTPEVTSQTSL